MAPDERTRIELSQQLAEQFGPDLAAYLMEVVPPFGWDEIATKSDLAGLENHVDVKLEALSDRMSRDFTRQINRLLMWLVPTVVASIGVTTTVAAIVTAAAR